MLELPRASASAARGEYVFTIYYIYACNICYNRCKIIYVCYKGRRVPAAG